MYRSYWLENPIHFLGHGVATLLLEGRSAQLVRRCYTISDYFTFDGCACHSSPLPERVATGNTRGTLSVARLVLLHRCTVKPSSFAKSSEVQILPRDFEFGSPRPVTQVHCIPVAQRPDRFFL